MASSDACTQTADGQHTWTPSPYGGSDCTSCRAATVTRQCEPGEHRAAEERRWAGGR